MRIFDKYWLVPKIAQIMKETAELLPVYDGIATNKNQHLLEQLKGFHDKSGSMLIFSRDAGMHSSGWWKNPDFERCYHLSVSFRDVITHEERPKDIKLTERWIEAFYGDNKRYVWSEPPFSPEGKKSDVWHYRVFVDEGWQPIIPRGEVYSKLLTEKEWLSFSDLQDAHSKLLQELKPQPGEQ